MTIADGILTALYWLHHLGAVAWVGGSIFYLLVLRPAFQRAAPAPETRRALAVEFRGVVHTAIILLVITGAIMTAAQLTREETSPQYLATLILKIGLAIYMMFLVWRGRRPAAPPIPPPVLGRWGKIKAGCTGTTALLILGVLVIGLSDVLAALK